MGKKAPVLFVLLLLCGFVCRAQNWDIDLLRHINLDRNRSLDFWFKLLTDYAAPLAYSIPVFLWLLALIQKNRKLQTKAGYIISASVLALLVSTVLKHIVNRPRPFVTYPFIEKITTGGSPSFPSGHTSDAFTLAISLSLAFPKWYVVMPSVLWAIAVGYSRMDLGVHYPTDVFASIVIAALSSCFCFLMLKRRQKKAVLAKDADIDKRNVGEQP